MAKIIVTPERLAAILPYVCDHETSSDPDGWTPENPLHGHCAVVALVAQSLFGGELVRGSLAGYPKWAHLRSHYWNRLGSDQEVRFADFTAAQFGNDRPDFGLDVELRPRDYVIGYPETARRYEILTWRIASELLEPGPLADDGIHRLCLKTAVRSPCQKMRFGAVLTRAGRIVNADCNRTITALFSLCKPQCIRLGIQSRTESMIGACAHAEEGAVWGAIHEGIPPSECELYVAGLDMRGVPILRDEPEYTCLRCAVMMHHARLGAIYVPMATGWARLSADDALVTAKRYALGEKKLDPDHVAAALKQLGIP
ncbi:MAG: hypothetical protein PHT12_01675 [Patescibacteria group bacterium]|nr:hypothetical protein [Patescibacteria group bacterium]